MEIEYIYPGNDDEEKDIERRIKQMQRENTLGCLVSALVILGGLFIFLSLLPFMLIFLGYAIIVIGIYTLYKAFLEEYLQKWLFRIKSRR